MAGAIFTTVNPVVTMPSKGVELPPFMPKGKGNHILWPQLSCTALHLWNSCFWDHFHSSPSCCHPSMGPGYRHFSADQSSGTSMLTGLKYNEITHLLHIIYLVRVKRLPCSLFHLVLIVKIVTCTVLLSAVHGLCICRSIRNTLGFTRWRVQQNAQWW